MEELGFEADLQIIDPKSDEETERRHSFADIYWKKRQRKGITQINARRLMRERNYFGAMLVNTGQADAMITGYSRSYPQVIRPILDLVEKKKDSAVSLPPVSLSLSEVLCSSPILR